MHSHAGGYNAGMDRHWSFEHHLTSKGSFAVAAPFALTSACLVALNWGRGPQSFSLAAGFAAISAFHLWLGMRAKRREKAMSTDPGREAGG